MSALVMMSLVAGFAAAVTAGAYSAVRIGGEALGMQLAALMGATYGAAAGVLGVGAGLLALLLIGAAHA